MVNLSVSSLVRQIYDGIHEPEVWDYVLNQLVDHTGCHFIFLATVDSQSHELSQANWYGDLSGPVQDAIRDYQAELHKIDPSILYAKIHPHAGDIDVRDIFGAQGWQAHPYVRWSASALRSAAWQLSYSAPQDDLTFGMAIHMDGQGEGLDGLDRPLVRLLFDHMDHAKRLAARPPNFENGSDAWIAIDQRGHILGMSALAETYLAANDGLGVSGRRLCCKDQASLDRVIGAALGSVGTYGSGGALSIMRRSGGRPWSVIMVPLPASIGPLTPFHAAALIRIIDPDAKMASSAAARWAALYGVTPAEARLAESLLTGEGNLRRVADRLGIAYATARVQLASIFEKTGVNSQAQLARLFTRIGL